jgi:hypothetical protein
VLLAAFSPTVNVNIFKRRSITMNRNELKLTRKKIIKQYNKNLLNHNLNQVREIISKRIVMVENGCCNTCRFCSPIELPFDEYVNECEIQGGYNPIFFTQTDLDSTTGVHLRCDCGVWPVTKACFAYEPGTSSHVVLAARAQRIYLSKLERAIELANQISQVNTGQSQNEFDFLIQELNPRSMHKYETCNEKGAHI